MEGNRKDLSSEDLLRLLSKLDAELGRRNQKATMYVVGGANISLTIDNTRTTTDLDAVIKTGFEIIFDAAQEVAKDEGDLGQDWLNSDFTGGTPDGGLAWSFMDNKDLDTPSVGFQGKSLTVELASPNMMLALKTLAQRDKDLEDIYLLMRKTGIKTPLELGRNLAKFTGRRMFEQQGQIGMPFHIDTEFKVIFDNAPDDLRPQKPAKTTLRQKLFGAISTEATTEPKPRCTSGKRHLLDGTPVKETRCTKRQGHSGSHRYRSVK